MSEQDMKQCKSCKEDIHKDAKKCPKCTADQRSFFARHKIITGFLILMAIGVLFPTSNKPKDSAIRTSNTGVSTEVKQTTKETVKDVVPEAKVEDNISREYKAALKKAESYSKTMHMSKAGIYDQLTSEYGEGFPPEAAQYAIDNMVADWNNNALEKARIYAESMNMSDSGIYEQLISEYGEQFTPEQAQYAIDNL